MDFVKKLITSKHALFTILFFSICFSSKSQTDSSISGNWKFKDIYESQKLDSVSANNLRKMFSEMTINLKTDHIYEATLFSKEIGNWEYFGESKILELRADKGRKNQIKVLSMNSNQLILEITRNKAFVMEKIIPGLE